MQTPIPIIDIFAGPGGLGEGFSALKSEKGSPLFKIKLSIEMDEFAHRTLELRAFYRQFAESVIPYSYYEYLKEDISRNELFNRHPKEAANAKKEAWQAELGKTDPDVVKTRIAEALNGATNWILIGGPPCQAYSLMGRSKLRGQSKWKYARDHRHFLYREYLKILADHQPPVFVMENVKGLLSSSRVKGQNTFELIISDLKNPLSVNRKNADEPLTYKLFSFSKKRLEGSEELEPKDFVVHSEEYGIPQARHRIIIFGIRSDVYKSDPDTLNKSDQVSIDDVIGDLPRLRSGLSKEADSEETWRDAIKTIIEAQWINSLPDEELKQAIISASENVEMGLTRGGSFSPLTGAPKAHQDWYIDNALDGVCGHESRSHIREDLHRYFFAAVYASLNDRSPTLNDYPKELLPNHLNVQEAIDGSKFNDRFRVQISGKPSTTVVSHISKDGHYYIHYDPSQCRSLTVREAARLQTFPDNYFFEGNRTQQYHQVGNAVPPLLANQIAAKVFDVMKASK